MPLDADEQRQVEKFKAKLEPLLAEVRKWQFAINAVYEAAGEEPPHEVAEGGTAAASSKPAARRYGRAEFYGQPLATVVRRVLTDHGPLDEHELHDKLAEGGYDFGENTTERAKNNMKISLGKNPAFGRTKTGFYTIVDGTRQKPRAAKEPKEGTTGIASVVQESGGASAEQSTKVQVSDEAEREADL